MVGETVGAEEKEKTRMADDVMYDLPKRGRGCMNMWRMRWRTTKRGSVIPRRGM